MRNTGSARDPFSFDLIHINTNGLYNTGSSTVTIPTSGYFYVYISSGSKENRPCVLTLKKISNQQTTALFNINRRTTTVSDEDTIGHGAVVQLTAGDQLKVVGEAGSYFYSDSSYYQLSFFGFQIYQN